MNTTKQSKFLRLGILFFYFAISVFVSNSNAASFDCLKANTQVETKICSDPDLSKMDGELSIIYNNARKSNKSIVSQQKIWLQKTRNPCKNISCLKEVYSLRIAELRRHDICPIDEKKIVGSWTRLKGGFFEEMGLSVYEGKKNFNSWLHHRPEMSGQWEVINCTLKIIGDNGAMNFDFRIDGFDSGKLYIFDLNDKEEAVYKNISK